MCLLFFQAAFNMVIVTYSPALAIEAGKVCITNLHSHTPLTHPTHTSSRFGKYPEWYVFFFQNINALYVVILTYPPA